MRFLSEGIKKLKMNKNPNRKECTHCVSCIVTFEYIRSAKIYKIVLNTYINIPHQAPM